MLNKFSSFKTVARELGVMYHSRDSPSDASIDDVRNHVTNITNQYAKLDTLARDYGNKMDAAICSARGFAAALQNLPVFTFSGDEQDIGLQNNNAAAVDHQTVALLEQRLRMTASVLQNIDATSQLKSLLANYRSFLAQFVQITLVPLRELHIPEVDKLRKVADRAENRAAMAMRRRESTGILPDTNIHLRHPSTHSSSDSSQSISVASASSSRNSSLSHKRSQRFQTKSSLQPNPTQNNGQLMKQQGVSSNVNDAEELRRQATVDRTLYEQQRRKLRTDVAHLTDEHNRLHSSQLLELIRHVGSTVDRFASAVNAHCSLVGAPHTPVVLLPSAAPRELDTNKEANDEPMTGSVGAHATMLDSIEPPPCSPASFLNHPPEAVSRDGFSHSDSAPDVDPDMSAIWCAATAARQESRRKSDANSSESSVSRFQSAPAILSQNGTNAAQLLPEASRNKVTQCSRAIVDWFELADELYLLASLKYENKHIAEMLDSCSAVEPVLLPHKDLRCMTLLATCDLSSDGSPFANAVHRLQSLQEARKPLHRNLSSPSLTETVDNCESSANLCRRHHHQVQYVIAKGTNFRNLKHVMLDLDYAFVYDQRLDCSFHRGFYEAGMELYNHVITKLNRDVPVKLVGRKFTIAPVGVPVRLARDFLHPLPDRCSALALYKRHVHRTNTSLVLVPHLLMTLNPFLGFDLTLLSVSDLN